MKKIIIILIACLSMVACKKEDTFKPIKEINSIIGGISTSDYTKIGKPIKLNTRDLIDSNFYFSRLRVKVTLDSLDKYEKIYKGQNNIPGIIINNTNSRNFRLDEINGKFFSSYNGTIIIDSIKKNADTTTIKVDKILKSGGLSVTIALSLNIPYTPNSIAQFVNDYGLRITLYYGNMTIGSGNGSARNFGFNQSNLFNVLTTFENQK